MQEHGTAAAGDARAEILIDLDDEVVEVILAREAVSGLVTHQPDRLVVAAVVWVLPPGGLGVGGPRPPVSVLLRSAVGPPPPMFLAGGAPPGCHTPLPPLGYRAPP